MLSELFSFGLRIGNFESKGFVLDGKELEVLIAKVNLESFRKRFASFQKRDKNLRQLVFTVSAHTFVMDFIFLAILIHLILFVTCKDCSPGSPLLLTPLLQSNQISYSRSSWLTNAVSN